LLKAARISASERPDFGKSDGSPDAFVPQFTPCGKVIARRILVLCISQLSKSLGTNCGYEGSKLLILTEESTGRDKLGRQYRIFTDDVVDGW
jgi:hypothetical protein